MCDLHSASDGAKSFLAYSWEPVVRGEVGGDPDGGGIESDGTPFGIDDDWVPVQPS